MLNDNLNERLILGDENNNNLIGTSEDNIIKGLEGADTLNGNAGNDSLDGGNGNNTLDGGVGDDTLVNNFGDVDGELGNDILIANYSDYEVAINNLAWRNRIKRNDNNDSLINLYSIENYQIVGTAFNDSLQGSKNDSLDGGEGVDKLNLDFYSETESIIIDLTATDNQVTFANTEVKNFEEIGSIYAGSNDDIIILGLTASTSSGYVDGLYGNDTLVLDYSGYETAIQNFDSRNYIERIDNDLDLINFYDIEQYQITGTEFDDSLQGNSNSDTLIGGSGDDEIYGNGGEDIITGVNPNLENAGVGEIDTLVGGTNSDYFLLGDVNQTFYDDGEYSSQGIEDYALIKDFDLTEDVLKLSGSKDNYRLGFSPITDITGTAIYRVGDDYETDELIAIIDNVTELNINSDVFSSIANSINDDATEDTEEEVEIIPKSEDVEEEVEIITEPDDIKISRLDSYQISRLVVGLSIDVDGFTEIELNTLADLNQDSFISAFDAYLAYSTFDEV